MAVQAVGTPEFHKSDPSGDLAHDVALAVAILQKYRPDIVAMIAALTQAAKDYSREQDKTYGGPA